MKRFLLIFFIFTLSFTQRITAADVIDNPAQPVTGTHAKQIDRIVKLTEAFRISDTGGDFFLKKPTKIRVAPDGSIYVMDYSQTAIVKFNARGEFLTRMVNKGEGPGELANLYGFWLGNNEIIAAGFMPVKVIDMDLKGKLIKEFRVNGTEYFFNFMGRFGGKYYFYIDPLERGEGLKITQIRLVSADEKGVITKTGLTFPVKRVLHSTQRTEKSAISGKTHLFVNIETAHITRFNYTLTADNYMYLTTDERYLIYQYDFEKDRVVKKFRRQYIPVSYTPNPNDEFVNSPEFKALYKWEHYADVQRLLADGVRVWALTSTVDKTRGILVDVFDARGTYIDRFYLQIPTLEYPDDKVVEHLYYYNGFLYTIEPDDEDNPNIVKYKVENSGSL